MKKELIFSLVGYVCVLIPAYIMGLWIYVSTRTEHFDFDKVKQEYLSYFPTALASGRWLGAISIALAGIAIFSLNASTNHIRLKIWKGINTALIVLSGLLVLMNLWSLM